jgi:polysaccharide chain length determinant protein (PEP-CTERM system associated)
MLPKKFDLDQYKSVFLRRKWYVIVPFFVTLAATAVYILITPRVYRASTLILVQRQTVPENYIRTTVTASLSDRIATIKQQVTSRSNLEGLIKKYDLYASEDPTDKGLTMQEKVSLMRKHINVWVIRGAAFKIVFIYSNPELVMRVANDLTANFIEENLRVREQQSVGTTKFLQSELDRIEGDLKSRESALTAYKQKHMGALPDQLSSNLSMLSRLSTKVLNIERRLDEARSQKIMIQGQIENFKSMYEALQVDDEGVIENGGETFVSPELGELRQRLETLRLRYTDNHPDVLKLERMIARIEEDRKQPPTGEDDAQIEQEIPPAGGDIFAGRLESLMFHMNSIEQTIQESQRERAETQREIATLTKRIEDTPRLKLELISLQRDYDTIRGQYANLLAKKLQSQLAESLESRQKGEQFKVVDKAKLPEKPFKPDIPKLLLAGLFAGLAAGCGLVLGMEYLDKSFRDYNEIREFLQIPLLAVIPRIETSDDTRKKKRLRICAYCLSGCFLVVVGVGVWLWFNGNLEEWVKMLAHRS